MKKIAIIIFCIAVFLILGLIVCIFFIHSKNPQDILQITDKEIIFLLAKNKDSNNYMQNHKDFKIQDKIVLTKDSILAGQNGQNFKEVYQGLKLEDNRYLRVDLINTIGDRGLIAVIDFKEKNTPKAYEFILLKVSTNQNGQTSSATENK